MTMKGRTLMPRAERVQSILAAAAREFAENGYAETSMDDIAAAAGVTKLIIYRHFESKRDLYELVLAQVRERLREATGAPDQFSGDSLAGLLRVAREAPDGFLLLFRYAAREPQFAAYSRQFDEHAVTVTEQSLSPIPDPLARRWLARLLARTAVDAVIAWLETGDPARDADLLRWLRKLLGGMARAVAAPDPDGAAPSGGYDRAGEDRR